MDAGMVGTLVGALLPTFLLSRLLLWIFRQPRTLVKAIFANLSAALFACVLSAFGHADGGPLDWSYSWLYLAAQAIWLIMDIVILNKRSEA